MAVTDGKVMKGKRNGMSALLQQRALQQLHIKHMGGEKMRLLAKEYIYCININTDIANTIKSGSTYLEFWPS